MDILARFTDTEIRELVLDGITSPNGQVTRVYEELQAIADEASGWGEIDDDPIHAQASAAGRFIVGERLRGISPPAQSSGR